ncbi:MAG TPA: hypothetical protein VE219_03660 [Candidatus Sulfotelmatobacter sp.]|nr:hypothetical protein [Candidatus Sulfotelmatobacter sp.]
MVVSEAAVARPPSPDECDHQSPVLGIMAHEFSPYPGAEGPEGPRRTTMHYGPVVGGLPIQAWHCERCGLLRLEYYDGRKEERRLYPGPQPGLLAVPLPEDPEREYFGMQARVSGLSAPVEFFEAYAAATPPTPLISWRPALPPLGAVTWLTVAGLSFVALGLLIAGILAVYDVQTPSSEGPLVSLIAAVFVGVVLLQILAAAFRHFFPGGELAPSAAVAGRGRPELDAATRTVVILLVLAVIGLFTSAVLATYDIQTSGAEWPVFIFSLGCCVVAGVVKIIDSARRHFNGR